MTFYAMMLAFVQFLIGIVIFIPAQLLVIVGSIFPECGTLGVIGLPASWINEGVQWVRWGLPLWHYMPMAQLWLFANTLTAYLILRWILSHLPWLISLGSRIWIIIVIIYIILGAVSFFIGDGWRDSEVFSDAFGGSPTSTSGGGLGGGGGGSW